MAYTQKDFIEDLAIFSAGGILGPARTRKLVTFAGKKGIQLAGLAATRTVFPATLGAARLAGTAARRHPVAAAGALGYGAHQAGLFDPVYERAAGLEEELRERAMESEIQRLYERAGKPDIVPLVRKKAASKFNIAVKKGMAAVKKSTSNGKRGKLRSPRAALSMVSKVISAKKKKKKAPKSGIRRKIWGAIGRYV